MSETTARYGMVISADGTVAVKVLRDVHAEMDGVAAAGKRVADSSGALTQAQINATYASQKAAEQYRAQADSLGVASTQVQKLLDRYDPLGTKLALADEFKAIGDTDGARALIEEIIAEASGDMKARAQKALAQLG